jgi:hypothetical protein
VTHESYRSVIDQLNLECNGARRIFTPDTDSSNNEGRSSTMCAQLKTKCFEIWEQLFGSGRGKRSSDKVSLLEETPDLTKWRCGDTIHDAKRSGKSDKGASSDNWRHGGVCLTGTCEAPHDEADTDATNMNEFEQTPQQPHWDYPFLESR